MRSPAEVSAVHHAIDGTVVFAGKFRSYGNLIIIKHNETFLSAYAHINKILVKEDSKVSKGQLIAKLGDTDSIKPILHFQIRKSNGAEN